MLIYVKTNLENIVTDISYNKPIEEGWLALDSERDQRLHVLTKNSSSIVTAGDVFRVKDHAELGHTGDLEQAWVELREIRNQKLRDCDWVMLSDVTLDDETKALWLEYRQSLRDLPDNVTAPYLVEWPELPV